MIGKIIREFIKKTKTQKQQEIQSQLKLAGKYLYIPKEEAYIHVIEANANFKEDVDIPESFDLILKGEIWYSSDGAFFWHKQGKMVIKADDSGPDLRELPEIEYMDLRQKAIDKFNGEIKNV